MNNVRSISLLFKKKIDIFTGCIRSCCVCLCSSKATTLKILPKTSHEEEKCSPRGFGQPAFTTHPHLINIGEVVPGIKLEEFVERRQRLMTCLEKALRKNNPFAKQHLVVIPSATKHFMTQKIPYLFRQNSDFLYLSGCLEPDSCLVMAGSASNFIATLFVQKGDEHSELWDGPKTGVKRAPSFFGVDQALPMSDLEQFLISASLSYRSTSLWYDFTNSVQPKVAKTMNDFLSNHWNNVWESPIPFVHELRLIKSTAEIALIQKSCKIGAEAIEDTIKSSAPGMSEHHLFAKVDYECRMRGAEYLAYPPVVAGGNRANTIHYTNNNQLISNGELVLMDAGCEYRGYSSDITRTWPISGKFSDPQRRLYEAILDIQLELIELCASFPTLNDLFNVMCDLLGQKLQDLGVLSNTLSKDTLSRVAYSFCPHHVSHYLGMDVHDTTHIPRNIPLKPGMVITVEPGIYISRKNKLATSNYQGIGVRIEDDVLITETGPVVLSARCPKHVEAIEMLIKNNRF